MMDLQQWSEREMQLVHQVSGLKGSITQKILSLRESGVFDAYVQILSAYVSAAEDLSARTSEEALKRALFLIWHHMIEPNFLTGMDELPVELIQRAYAVLDKRLANGNLDPESQWMLRYYARDAGTFTAVWKVEDSALAKLVREAENQKIVLPKPDVLTQSMAHRGQMGRYFLSFT